MQRGYSIFKQMHLLSTLPSRIFDFHFTRSRRRIDDDLPTGDSMNTLAELDFAGFAWIIRNLTDEEDRRAIHDVDVL